MIISKRIISKRILSKMILSKKDSFNKSEWMTIENNSEVYVTLYLSRLNVWTDVIIVILFRWTIFVERSSLNDLRWTNSLFLFLLSFILFSSPLFPFSVTWIGARHALLVPTHPQSSLALGRCSRPDHSEFHLFFNFCRLFFTVFLPLESLS